MKKSFKILLFCALIGSLLLSVACHKEEEIYVEYQRTDGKEKEYTFEDEIEENDCILKDLPGHNDIEGYHVIQGVTEEEFQKILEDHHLCLIFDGIVRRGNAYIALSNTESDKYENILVYFYNEENPTLDRESVLKKYHYEEGHENIEEKIKNAETAQDIFNCIDNGRCLLSEFPGHDYGDFHLIETSEEEWYNYKQTLPGELMFSEIDEITLDNGLTGRRGLVHLYEYTGRNPVFEKVILCFTDNANVENDTEVNIDNYIDENMEDDNENNDEEFTDEDDMILDDSIEFEEDE